MQQPVEHNPEGVAMIFALTLKAFANFSPGFALKPWVKR
jgi:hypothetical protein